MSFLKRFSKTLLLTYIFSNLFLLGIAFADQDEPSEGQIAPDFEITQLDGTSFKLSDYRGKQSVYLVFWNTWCTYCMKKIPKLQDAQANLSNDIKIIAVNTSLRDSVSKTIAFQKQYNINYPLAFDHHKTVTDLYGVWGTPTEFIIDINGIIQHRDGIPQNLQAELASWNTVIPANSNSPTISENDNCQSNGATTC